MKKIITVVAAGIGGYGNTCLRAIRERGEAEGIRLVGCADPNPATCSHLEWLNEQKIPVFNTLEEFYLKKKADLAVVTVPIHLHLPLLKTALQNGSNVLMEKPTCATIQEAAEMAKIRDESGLLVAVGYQWSYAPATLELKKDILAGRYGKSLRFKTLIVWPRDKSYYGRSWAARQKAADGKWILDSIVMNATAHYLHNPLFLAGDAADRAAVPAGVKGELYRANEIENFDTACMRVECENAAEILYLATHASERLINPSFELAFEKGVVKYGPAEGLESMRGYFEDGTQKDYGFPDIEVERKLFDVADCIRTGENPVCGIETAMPHLICVNGIQQAAPIYDFNKDEICESEKEVRYMPGLADALEKCYLESKLPCEAGFAFSRGASSADLRGYDFFTGVKG